MQLKPHPIIRTWSLVYSPEGIECGQLFPNVSINHSERNKGREGQREEGRKGEGRVKGGRERETKAEADISIQPWYGAFSCWVNKETSIYLGRMVVILKPLFLHVKENKSQMRNARNKSQMRNEAILSWKGRLFQAYCSRSEPRAHEKLPWWGCGLKQDRTLESQRTTWWGCLDRRRGRNFLQDKVAKGRKLFWNYYAQDYASAGGGRA